MNHLTKSFFFFFFQFTGAYGTVYKARHISNPNLIVAIKKIRLPLTEEGIPTSTLREIATLRQLETYEHPNIIRYVAELNNFGD